jgi:hypothetical protein
VIDLLVSLGHAEFLRARSNVVLSAGKDAWETSKIGVTYVVGSPVDDGGLKALVDLQ